MHLTSHPKTAGVTNQMIIPHYQPTHLTGPITMQVGGVLVGARAIARMDGRGLKALSAGVDE